MYNNLKLTYYNLEYNWLATVKLRVKADISPFFILKYFLDFWSIKTFSDIFSKKKLPFSIFHIKLGS